MRLALLCALLLSTFTAVGQVFVDPIAPTSAMPIEVRIWHPCGGVADPVAERTGSLIKVTVTITDLCSPPIWRPGKVVLEPLPPGEYRVEGIRRGAGTPYGSTTFVVRDAGKYAFTVRPSAVAEFGTGLRMWIDSIGNDALCGFGCAELKVRVGGTLATNVRRESLFAASFDAPSLEPGLYDVTLEQLGTVTTLPGAVYVFEEPDPSVFERVLFPVLANVAGANGSQWEARGMIANPHPWWVENANSVEGAECIMYPCGERIAPGVQIVVNHGRSPHGIALLAPRAEAPLLSFALRVRDVSRVKEGFGTEIPVVRERDMVRNAQLVLLDVPVDPRYRVKLRMYALEPFVFDEQITGKVKIGDAEHTIEYQRSCDVCEYDPAYAELDLPPGGENEFVTITIEPPYESFGWAFATVTNNETQQVTIVTPNGEGATVRP